MNAISEGVFADIKKKKMVLHSQGRTVFDCSIGSPGIPPPEDLRRLLAESVCNKEAYCYPVAETDTLKEAIACWYERRFGVFLNPDTEAMALAGAHDALVHFCLAYTDPGDTVIVPDPCYPGFLTGPILSGADLYPLPTLNNGDPVKYFAEIPADVAAKAKVMFVCYPGNPTTELAGDNFYAELIRFAKKYDIIVVKDSAYIDIVFDGHVEKSFLQYEGAMDIGIELMSLSKSFGLAGARIGFAAGNRDIIRNFHLLKSNIDYSLFLPLQTVAAAALHSGDAVPEYMRQKYERSRNALVSGLHSAGWHVDVPPATIFLWARIPQQYGFNDVAFASVLAEQSGVLTVPGSAFGSKGKGYVRFSMTLPEADMYAAAEAISNSGILR